MLIISYVVKSVNKTGDDGHPDGVVAAALLVFAILSIPLAVSCFILLEKIFVSLGY